MIQIKRNSKIFASICNDLLLPMSIDKNRVEISRRERVLFCSFFLLSLSLSSSVSLLFLFLFLSPVFFFHKKPHATAARRERIIGSSIGRTKEKRQTRGLSHLETTGRLHGKTRVKNKKKEMEKE